MNLQGIVAVSGKPGLWRALAQNKTGYILESLDEHRTKLVANLSTAKIAALHEITLFGEDEDIRLIDVFERMKTAGNIPDVKADGQTMRKFFREVAPDHDEEKVYASDMKKVIAWYQLLKDMPLFNEADPGAPETVGSPAEEPGNTEVITAEKEEVTDTAAAPKPKSKQQKSPVKNKE